MTATVGRVHQCVQQIQSLLTRIGVVMKVHRLRMLHAAVAAGLMQIAYRGEYQVQQHREREQGQSGNTQLPGNAMAWKGQHGARMLRDRLPVRQTTAPLARIPDSSGP